MKDAFIMNDDIDWVKTSNCKVFKKACQFMIQVLYRARPTDKVGKRLYSSKYDTVFDAEDNAFEFRYNLESIKCKARLDEYKLNITSKLSGSTNVTSKSNECAPPKRLLPSSKLKSYSMSGSALLNNKAGSSENPWNNPPNTSSIPNEHDLSVSAEIIQRAIGRRDMRRSAAQLKKTIKNQAYRARIVRYLSSFIIKDECHMLLLGSDDNEVLKTFSAKDRIHVAIQAIHICDALQYMISCTNEEKEITWMECCEFAKNKSYGKVKSARTIMNWYLQLHLTPIMKFRRSETGRAQFIAKSPFAEDESLLVQYKSWARTDIEHLTVRKTTDFINDILLVDWTVQQLKNNRIAYPVSEYVAARWMKEAGLKYEKHTKSYYVDRHEDKDVIADRKTYLERIFQTELFEHCWIQMTCPKYRSLIYMNKIKSFNVKQEKGTVDKKYSNLSSTIVKYTEDHRIHFYKDEKDVAMVEMHVDDIYAYNESDCDLPSLPPFGGNLSVRLKPNQRPRIAFGQDEAIFRSSQLNDSCWTIDGESTLRTKGQGSGIMVSAIVSRAFGFGLAVNDAQLLVINAERKDKVYKDAEAATYLYGSPNKSPLTESPFVRYLNYGQGKDGYWTYRHMILQLEDCHDCTNHIIPQFDCSYELDHSSGHNAERPDGLSTTASVINYGWGGKQRKMRSSLLTINDVGDIMHARRILPGMIQSMVFTPDDLPPILRPDAPKYDTIIEGVSTTRKLTKAEIKLLLEKKGLNSDGNVEQIRGRALLANIPIQQIKGKMNEGYVGKPKGAAQILFERGFVDSNLTLADGSKLCMNGTSTKDPITGAVKVNKKTSAIDMLRRCYDFKHEKTQMMYILNLLGVFLDLTPKCHPEIAGRGVEYAWGYAKLRFRIEFNDAIAKHLKQNVLNSLNQQVLTVNRIRKYARKAREYKLTYSLIFDINDGETGSTSKDDIEHITKEFKAHRSAMDSDFKFITES